MSNSQFPVGGTIGDRRYLLTDDLFVGDEAGIYEAIDREQGGPPFLVTCSGKQTLLKRELWERHGYEAEGVLPLVEMGPVTCSSGDEPANYALVEGPIDGQPLRLLMDQPWSEPAAVSVGLSLARLLQKANQEGLCLVGLRPELIIVETERRGVQVTGFTTRAFSFLHTVRHGCIWRRPAFERIYAAPEADIDGNASDRAQSFALGIIIAELATGEYPFPRAYLGLYHEPLNWGQHTPLKVSAPLERILARCLRPRPEERPSLERLADQLTALSEEDLARSVRF